MEQPCKQCGTAFEIDERDHAFYRRIDVPLPTLCPQCRHVRRHGHINDYTFYQRLCDGCHKSFISVFPPQSAYRVFCQTCWYADTRHDKEAGMAYDPAQPFFPQFDALMHRAPQMGIIGGNNENCDYSESVANCKNTYLISESSNCEDCSYCYWIQKTTDCLDCGFLHACERCYAALDCAQCYGSRYIQNCSDCWDSAFLEGCSGCRHCFFCTNLRQREYCIQNEQLTKEAWEQQMATIALNDRMTVQSIQVAFDQFLLTQPRRHLQMENTENCTGNYVHNAKNCREVYHCYEAEDCAYGEHVWRGAKDCVDSNTAGRHAELLYETTNSGLESYNVKFSRYCWGSRDVEYSNQCMDCRDLFGCVSLKANARFCILNAQYTEDEYRSLVAHIKDRMRQDGEYGEFFPLSLSLFGYNNSVSYDTFPLSREEVLRNGWKWEEQQSGTFGKGTLAPTQLPSSIDQTDETILQHILTCDCGRNYRIVPHELSFYLRERIPLPLACPLCRHRQRLMKRAPRALHQRPCTKCGNTMASTYAPDRPEIVYCEECYLREVY